MENFLLNALALLRPILLLDPGTNMAGLTLPELGGIVLSTGLMVAYAIRASTAKTLRFSVTDLLIAAYVAWCIAIFVIYFDKSDVREVVKRILPLLTYVVAKNVIQDEKQFRQVMGLMLLGYVVPVVSTTVMTLMGIGVAAVNYWTAEPRYQGLFENSHNMGHGMAFFVMLATLYIAQGGDEKAEKAKSGVDSTRAIILSLCIMALYCLYWSRVRTALLGLFVFLAIVFVFYYKRRLLVVLAAALLSASFLIEPVKLQLFPEGAQAEKDVNFDATMYGSGRPIIWKEYMEFFRGMPIDRQIAGIGIGNTGTQPWNDGLPYDTHNDWLQVLVFSGYVGLLLFVALNLALLRNILTLSGRERHLFIALFSAVAIMNFVSNSYVSRFGLGQMYYMLLAYVEVRRMGTSRSPGFRRRADVGLTGISQKSEAAQEETH